MCNCVYVTITQHPVTHYRVTIIPLPTDWQNGRRVRKIVDTIKRVSGRRPPARVRVGQPNYSISLLFIENKTEENYHPSHLNVIAGTLCCLSSTSSTHPTIAGLTKRPPWPKLERTTNSVVAMMIMGHWLAGCEGRREATKRYNSWRSESLLDNSIMFTLPSFQVSSEAASTNAK